MIKVLEIIANVMMSLLAVYYVWLLAGDIIGVFYKWRHYSDPDPYNFAVVVCARNEANVIGNLLDSLQKQNYPADRITVFVIAHNCTDDTARVAEEHGARVYVHNDPSETFKGQALTFAVRQIRQDFPGAFDALCIFDADNVAGHDFIREVNGAFHAGADVVQGFRHSKNHRYNKVTEIFGNYWYEVMLTQNLPHTAMNLPVTVSGTGFAVTMEALGDKWETFTMLEDVEFSVQMTLAGRKCILAPYALYYDEQPTDMKIGIRQRYRWAVGGYQVMGMYLPRLIKALPRLRLKGVKASFDLLINPIMLASLLGVILGGIVVAHNYGLTALLIYLVAMPLAAWFAVLPSTVILFARMHLNLLKNLTTFVFLPFFLLLSMVLAVPALFARNPKWAPIPHGDNTSIDSIEGVHEVSL